ncbi:MAG: FAD:protein FMN transferase [Muribaculaceae bacterium]|nr:FAD:protein FMN transferase [Muribaculaceae bacterium]
MIQKVMRGVALAPMIAILVVAISCNQQRKQYFKNSGVVWTTEYHIKYEAQRDLNDSIQKLFDEIDKSASAFNKQSLITAINENRSDVADAYFVRLFNKAIEVNSASDGVYDPTVMPLVNAWGFGYKKGALPTKEQIDSLLQFVGLSHVRLDGSKVVKDDPRVQFDFSSIAKGMACDAIAEMLERNGAENYMVEIGGEVVAHGVNDAGKTWHISIDMPEPDDINGAVHKSALVINLDNLAVATSGNYRKFKEVEGKKVSHIVNPKTGESESSALLSVSVIASDCMSADAWATACMAMGDKKTQSMMENNTKLGVMTICSDAEGNFVVWSNKRFADLVE